VLLTLLIDPPQDGLTNMAVDEALLAMAAAGELGPVLRFYQWSPATLSLGYFQRYAERAAHPASAACDVVRRASGGGAILHDRELTYSLVLPAGHPLAARAEPLYRAVHQALIDVLAERGFDARFWDDVQPSEARDAKISAAGEAFACGDTAEKQAHPEANLESSTPSAQRPAPNAPFLCFQRRSPGDLVMRASGETSSNPAAWHKILGSAQRRRQGAVLQHGSFIWGRSKFAPEMPGVSELAGTDFAPDFFPSLIRSWSEKLAKVLDFELSLSKNSAQFATDPWLALAREKFHEPSWLQSR
jgi:lipoate-protein ligase A